MARLIDADELRERALRGNIPLATSSEMMVRLVDIDAAPTVDAEPVMRGCWESDQAELWECSLCGKSVLEKEGWLGKYCPHCGARMDGEGGGEG